MTRIEAPTLKRKRSVNSDSPRPTATAPAPYSTVDQKARTLAPRGDLPDLILHPRERRARGHVRVDDSARPELHHDEDVDHAKRGRPLHEEVTGVDLSVTVSIRLRIQHIFVENSARK